MTINVRNNRGRNIIRFTCPISGRVVSKTYGSYWDKVQNLEAQHIAARIDYAIAQRLYTGSIEDYLPESQKKDITPLTELLKIKLKNKDDKAVSTVLKKLLQEKEIYTPTSLKRFFDKGNYTSSTHNRYLAVIKSVRPDLCTELSRKKVVKEGGNPFTESEIDRILSNLQTPVEKHLIPFWLKCGFRNGELKALTLSDFSYASDTFILEVNKTYSSGKLRSIPKNKKNRRIPLSSKDWFKFREPYLTKEDFYGDIDFSNFIRDIWTPLLKRSNVEYKKPYTLRHTAISVYLQKGGSTADCSKVFGTSLKMIEEHYLGLVSSPKVV